MRGYRGVVNNAFRMIGQDIYADLIENPTEVHSLFEVILATMRSVYGLLDDLFDDMDPVPIGNCNVTMMGPALYEQSVLEFDAQEPFRCRAAAGSASCGAAPLRRAGRPLCRVVCQTAGTGLAPGVVRVGRSGRETANAGLAFLAMISPRVLLGDLNALRDKLDRAVADGADDLAVWNIDPATNPERLRRIFAIIRNVCSAHDRLARFCDAFVLGGNRVGAPGITSDIRSEWAIAPQQGDRPEKGASALSSTVGHVITTHSRLRLRPK